ncbi:hypothetical protein CPT_Pagan_007 [Xanthomonas phage Pagan]|uniref:Uncharacterized protein n=1 Tax=Xanthomonas phage Pagan TaxID=2591104 RepID=A0A5B9NC66_9CAUD|nr:hypothetical protein CPT_Pagan_007 [Xanthomonas phage Pagan]
MRPGTRVIGAGVRGCRCLTEGKEYTVEDYQPAYTDKRERFHVACLRGSHQRRWPTRLLPHPPIQGESRWNPRSTCA